MSAALDIIERLAAHHPAVERHAATLAVRMILPITRGLDMKVMSLDDAGCDVRLPFCKKSRNHVGGMYLGVLLIAAEVSMALYTLRLLRADRFSVLVKKTQSEFTQQSKEPVIARCRPDPILRERVIGNQQLEPGERDMLSFDVDVLFERALQEGLNDVMGKVHFEVSAMRRRS